MIYFICTINDRVVIDLKNVKSNVLLCVNDIFVRLIMGALRLIKIGRHAAERYFQQIINIM